MLENGCSNIDLESNKIKKGFTKWFQENENKTIIVFDGLDRINRSKLPKSVKSSLDRILTSKQWISNILARRVLTNSKVILTSRPFALCSLDGEFVTQYSYTLQGFAEEDVQKALNLYVEREEDKDKAKSCFKTITQKNLMQLSTNPNNVFLLFQLFKSELDFESEDITAASLYNKVFNNVLRTQSYSHNKPTEEIMIKLEKMCFELTCQRKFVIEEDDLIDNLTFDDLENLVPIKAKNKSEGYRSEDREKSIQISHQLGQVSNFCVLLV